MKGGETESEAVFFIEIFIFSQFFFSFSSSKTFNLLENDFPNISRLVKSLIKRTQNVWERIAVEGEILLKNVTIKIFLSTFGN